MFLWSVLLLISSTLCEAQSSSNPRMTPDQYHRERQELVQKEANTALGADIVLNEKEKIVNEHLMSLKRMELTEGFKNPLMFAPARHIFEVLDKINTSPLFKLICKLPKGGVLHAHDTALASTAAILNATYQEHLWQRGEFSRQKGPEFRFSRTAPAGDGWEQVADVRKRVGNIKYDEDVKQQFTLYDENPTKAYKSINDVWSRFAALFMALEPLVTFKPVWERYFRQALEEFYDDNVMYLEFRGILPKLYDLDGKTYEPEEVVQIYVKVTEEFKKTHSRFAGTKFIYAPHRLADNQTIDKYLSIAKDLHEKHGSYVVGFDLVGQEDLGRPLLDFVHKLLALPPSINLVFHAGETNWNGLSTDENLIDAVLLGTKRIGHGYALLKHPLLLEEVKKRKICVEINLVSNQVLKLVNDYRNHPANELFSTDFPLVISSDDPSFWRATPLSHDFYIAFLGVASAHQDLRLLKKLALNSLHYSLMSDQEKEAAMKQFESSWNYFVDNTVAEIQAKKN
ncbi:adenosine deaminase 2-A-like [Anopheles cruzii]|uniref:adenosine deaminase 2-A-like n=1 Tax=Anopheles cruzii TaxID=68878 RepID=UPI0022EC521A|nr:adenosine deaminase 2-A-like [Anopheles cruzii]XP_052862137.1 adenosine deaminase 2-A-like [Anopheles cruzii]